MSYQEAGWDSDINRILLYWPGVIAVAVFGLYGAATSKWDMSVKVEESGAFDAFWDAIAFIVNAIVFFYSGVACINFFVRCSHLKALHAFPVYRSLL